MFSPPRQLRQDRSALLASVLTLACLAGNAGPAAAADTSSQNAAPATATSPPCGPSSSLALPPGVNIDRLKLLDRGLHFKVYTTFLAHDEQAAGGSGLPPDMARVMELNRSSLERSLADAIMRSRRFKVYDMHASATADQSDVEVTAKISDAHQVLRPYLEGGRRISESWVRLSIQVKNMYTGENLLQSDAQVEGWTGRSNGRLVITMAEDVNSPDVKQKLAADFKSALYRAIDAATDRVEALLRPMARVVGVQGCQLDLFGGSEMGLQPQDELVVFRAQMRQLGATTVPTRVEPIALARCTGVGTISSHCDVVQSVPGYAPQDGDYAVITNESLQRTREQ